MRAAVTGAILAALVAVPTLASDYRAIDGDTLQIRSTGERVRDRYRRTLARVLVDGRDLAPEIIGAGLGRPYNGERRRPWCPTSP